MSIQFFEFTCACCKQNKKVTSYDLITYETFEQRDEFEKNYNLHEYWMTCIDNPQSWDFWGGKCHDITANQCYGRVKGFYGGLFVVNEFFKPGDIICELCIRKLDEEKIVIHIWTH